MHRPGDPFRNLRNLLSSAVALAAAATLASVSPTVGRAQAQGATTPVFEFEVASIKQNSDGYMSRWFTASNDSMRATGVTPFMMIQYVSGIFEDYRILGAPDWVKSSFFNIDAKVDSATAERLQKLSRTEQAAAWRHMLGTVLAERLQFKAHSETKDVAVYFLIVGKKGPSLQESKPSDSNEPSQGVWGGGGMRNGVVERTARHVSMDELAHLLSSDRTLGLQRLVFDKTGLTGKYDLALRYTPDYGVSAPPTGVGTDGQPPPPAPDPNGPTIFNALQDQLGLKLESGKGPVKIIAIDHIERPSGN